MRVDVSEIKTFRQCPRKWALSSRNAMHLRPTVTPRHFAFGTIFHEALHQLYLGADPEKVLTWVSEQIDYSEPSESALLSMVRGYIEQKLPDDLERYKILEIEHHFEIPIATHARSHEESGSKTSKSSWEPINLCGSIDMLVLEPRENEPAILWGFEHKTCKNFRAGAYLHLDDQLRTYNYVLYQIAEKHNQHIAEDNSAAESERWEVGGIILNETKKLLRSFQNQRHVHSESTEQLQRYVHELTNTARDISVESQYYNDYPLQPCADFMHCQMCEYNTICETYGVNKLPAQAEILEEFTEEFVEREVDHLDEKVEREVLN